MLARIFDKGDFVPSCVVQEILDTAFDILDKTGMDVVSESHLEALRKRGLKTTGNRVYIPKKQSRDFLGELKENRMLLKRDIESNIRNSFCGAINGYSMNYLSEDGNVYPFTVKSLEDITKTVQKISKAYPVLLSTAPGYPSDINGAMESLAKYRISAMYCDGELLFEPTNLQTTEYLFEMAAAVGQSVERLPVYPISPLTFGGVSLDIVLKYADKLKSTYVFSMPAVGLTAPMSVGSTFAMVWAEVLGNAFLTRELSGLYTALRPDIFPFDMRLMAMSFGTPEKFLYELMSADLFAQIMELPVNYHSTNIYTHSLFLDEQTAKEKTMLITAGAMKGATKFYCVGTLAWDKTFSIEQSIIDLEIINSVERLVRYDPWDSIIPDCAEYIREHIHKGFLMSDLSLDNYGIYLQYSEIFRHINSKSTDNNKDNLIRSVHKKLNEIEKLDAPCLLDKDVSEELDSIYKKAQEALE